MNPRHILPYFGIDLCSDRKKPLPDGLRGGFCLDARRILVKINDNIDGKRGKTMNAEKEEAVKSESGLKFSLNWSKRTNLYVAATTLFLAVFATFASFKAAGYGNQAVLEQNRASNDWAYYQAKSIKETAYQIQYDELTLQAENNLWGKDKILALANTYQAEVARYNQEQNEIAKSAKEAERRRDEAQELNKGFGQSLIFLQIGILLSSLAAIGKYAYYWYAGAAVGAVGLGVFLLTFLKTF